jgi:hypothetical protein
MLLNKFQRQHEEARREEEMIRRQKDHWRCPFFIYCWEEGIKLPSVDNCPECNGPFRDSQCFKRPCFDNRKQRSIIRDKRDYEEKRVPVHDRLGSKVTVKDRMRVSVHDQLEERANNRVPNEEPLCHEPERRRAPEQSGVRHPWWCLDRLTKSQKRRVQRLCQWEQQQQEERRTPEKKKVKSQVWRAKPRADDAGTSESAADINMVFILPIEFMAPASDGEMLDTEGGMAQLALDPMPAIFEKPEEEKRRHLKALFLKGQVDGRPVTK